MIPLDVNIERYLDMNIATPRPTLDRVEHPRDVSKLTIKAYDAERDQTIHLTGEMSTVTYEMLPAEPDERETGKRINDAAAGRRWATFTDAELKALMAWGRVTEGEYGEFEGAELAFADEIADESERRRSDG